MGRIVTRLTSAVRMLVIPLVLVIYVTVLFNNINESAHRSLKIQQDVPDAEQVHLTIKIVGVDIARSEVTARVRFRLAGTIAKDEITPAVDLKLLLNAVRGQQLIQFRKGDRLGPIEAVFSLEGESNRYPFDTYQTELAFLIMKPGRSATPPPAAAPAAPEMPGAGRKKSGHQKAGAAKQTGARSIAEAAPGEILVGPAALEKNEPVPVSFDLSASVAGIKFEEDVVTGGPDGVTRIPINLRRARGVITVSIGIQLMMMCLALSLLAMVLYGTVQGKESVAMPLSVAVTLIFGLPALRNAQPDVPPLGALSDYVSYLWAEFIVAASTVIVIWTWILRHYQKRTSRVAD